MHKNDFLIYNTIVYELYSAESTDDLKKQLSSHA